MIGIPPDRLPQHNVVPTQREKRCIGRAEFVNSLLSVMDENRGSHRHFLVPRDNDYSGLLGNKVPKEILKE